MTRLTLGIAALVAAALGCLAVPPARADPPPWRWPIGPQSVGRAFEPPAERYGAGHRGIDLPAAEGVTVRAVAEGVVAFAGSVAGTGVVSIDHGGERSTYQPIAASVRAGERVVAGQPLGTLLGSPSHCAGPCLHLGRRTDAGTYLDPLGRLPRAGFRLIDPDGPPPDPPSGGPLRRPVGGPVTSAFGLRTHPVTGVRSLHDGTDFGAACGTAVRAAAGGVVTAVRRDAVYGLRVEVAHGRDLATSYSHLSTTGVATGEILRAGQTLGRVGDSGLSTGCHLHFLVRDDGRAVDPAGYV